MEKLVKEKFSRAASRLRRPRYQLHHSGYLADNNADLMLTQTPQLLLEISRHQEEENAHGKGFNIRLCISCQM